MLSMQTIWVNGSFVSSITPYCEATHGESCVAKQVVIKDGLELPSSSSRLSLKSIAIHSINSSQGIHALDKSEIAPIKVKYGFRYDNKDKIGFIMLLDLSAVAITDLILSLQRHSAQ